MDKKHIASAWYFLAAFLIMTALQAFQGDRFLIEKGYGSCKAQAVIWMLANAID